MEIITALGISVMFEIELRNFVDIAKADEYDSKTMV